MEESEGSIESQYSDVNEKGDEKSEGSIESQYSDVNEKGDAFDESDESQVSKPRLKSASTYTL